MPGLLDTDDFALKSRKAYAAYLAEACGVALFAFLGGAAPASFAPWANGILLSVLGADLN